VPLDTFEAIREQAEDLGISLMPVYVRDIGPADR
jgi:hypothetical protein